MLKILLVALALTACASSTPAPTPVEPIVKSAPTKARFVPNMVGEKMEGMTCVTLTPESGLVKAGIKPGDIILAVNNKPILDLAKGFAAVSRLDQGKYSTVKIRRDGKEIILPKP